MKHIRILALALLSLSSCASSSGAASTPSGGNQLVLSKPLASAQQSAVNALSTIGCDIEKQQASYVEGFRPHKMGFLVGSGGETVRVWLTAMGSQQTGVKVETSKSILGIAGQRNWDDEVISAMKSN